MKTKIALFYARKDVGGGSTSFTVHLYRAMKMAGIDVTLYRFHDAASKPRKPRDLASYVDTPCHFVTPKEALAVVKSTASLLVAPEHSKRLVHGVDLKRLMAEGMRIVLHDPNEFKVFDHLDEKELVVDPICIRPTMQRFFPNATFIHHPYVREFTGHQGGDLEFRKAAATIARITFVKRPEILLDANRLLDTANRIAFHGAENRLFTFVKFKEDYPEFKQGGHNLPMVWGASARAIKDYAMMIDMTHFPDDGGGSQYTFMEAWDAGAVVVVNRDWLRFPGEMVEGVNCLAISSADELADLIRNRDQAGLETVAKTAGRSLDDLHDPILVAKRYAWHLTGSFL
jgi:hypothetical protein